MNLVKNETENYYHWAGQTQAIDEFILNNNLKWACSNLMEKHLIFCKPFLGNIYIHTCQVYNY